MDIMFSLSQMYHAAIKLTKTDLDYIVQCVRNEWNNIPSSNDLIYRDAGKMLSERRNLKAEDYRQLSAVHQLATSDGKRIYNNAKRIIPNSDSPSIDAAIKRQINDVFQTIYELGRRSSIHISL